MKSPRLPKKKEFSQSYLRDHGLEHSFIALPKDLKRFPSIACLSTPLSAARLEVQRPLHLYTFEVFDGQRNLIAPVFRQPVHGLHPSTDPLMCSLCRLLPGPQLQNVAEVGRRHRPGDFQKLSPRQLGLQTMVGTGSTNTLGSRHLHL